VVGGDEIASLVTDYGQVELTEGGEDVFAVALLAGEGRFGIVDSATYATSHVPKYVSSPQKLDAIPQFPGNERYSICLSCLSVDVYINSRDSSLLLVVYHPT
jgi:hypothetical protein